MVGWQAALWGLFGGFALEGLDLRAAVRRDGTWPWRAADSLASASSYLVAELIRLLVGAGLAWATAASGQTSGPFAAVAVGVTAPLIVERLTQVVPLADGDAVAPSGQPAQSGPSDQPREQIIGAGPVMATAE